MSTTENRTNKSAPGRHRKPPRRARLLLAATVAVATFGLSDWFAQAAAIRWANQPVARQVVVWLVHHHHIGGAGFVLVTAVTVVQFVVWRHRGGWDKVRRASRRRK